MYATLEKTNLEDNNTFLDVNPVNGRGAFYIIGNLCFFFWLLEVVSKFTKNVC